METDTLRSSTSAPFGVLNSTAQGTIQLSLSAAKLATNIGRTFYVVVATGPNGGSPHYSSIAVPITVVP